MNVNRLPRAEISQAVRLMAAVAVAFAVYELFHLPQGYWAVFTVIIVMQGSIGGTLDASLDRMFGTDGYHEPPAAVVVRHACPEVAFDLLEAVPAVPVANEGRDLLARVRNRL